MGVLVKGKCWGWGFKGDKVFDLEVGVVWGIDFYYVFVVFNFDFFLIFEVYIYWVGRIVCVNNLGIVLIFVFFME